MFTTLRSSQVPWSLLSNHKIDAAVLQKPLCIFAPPTQTQKRDLSTTLNRDQPQAGKGNGGLKRHEVAGSFLFRWDERKKNYDVALWRRSDKVRAYQNKLAPLSGSVEEWDSTPLATALREIQEETTLPSTSLVLLQKGKPYDFFDSSIDRLWSLYPYAFRLKSSHEEGGCGEEGIQIGGEHSGWEWHDPSSVKSLSDIVPRLFESLRRAWPQCDLGYDGGLSLANGLYQMRHSRNESVEDLAYLATQVLRSVVERMDSVSLDEGWWANVRMTAWHIWKNGHQGVCAPLVNDLIAVLDRTEKIRNSHLDTPKENPVETVLTTIDDFLSKRQAGVDPMCQSLARHLQDQILTPSLSKEKVPSLNILTLSADSTILKCLSALAKNTNTTIDLRMLDLRGSYQDLNSPGIEIQRPVDQIGMKIALYPESSLARAMHDIDLIILGTDAISPAGDVIQKKGSLPLVLRAQHLARKVKTVVLSESNRIIGQEQMRDYELSKHESEHHRMDSLNQPLNLEWVPARLIDNYLTKDGTWSLDSIKYHSQWIDTEVDRFFKDL